MVKASWTVLDFDISGQDTGFVVMDEACLNPLWIWNRFRSIERLEDSAARFAHDDGMAALVTEADFDGNL